jgi:hypothetical protein
MSDNIELNRKLKQNLLKDQVPSHMQQKFGMFLMSRRPDGTDIDTWKFKDLIHAVSQFKKANCGMIQKPLVTITKVAEESLNWLTKETYYYIEYNTNALLGPQTTHSVKRTQQQFGWLRERIIVSFPGQYVPPVQTLEDQLPFFQIFLDNLLINDSFCLFEPFQDFLKLDLADLDKRYDNCPSIRKGAFMAFFDNFDKDAHKEDNLIKETYKVLAQNQYLDVDIEMPPVEEFYLFTDKLNDLVSKNCGRLDKLTKLSKELVTKFGSVAETLFKMGTELDGCIKERQEFFNVMANQQVDLAREDPFNALKEGITNWGSTMAQWSNEIQTNIQSYFRYNTSELKSLRELDYLRQYSLKQYTLEKKTLAKEKTSLWQSKDISTWQSPHLQSLPPQDQKPLLDDLNLALPQILPSRTLALSSMKNIVDWVGYCELSEVLIF